MVEPLQFLVEDRNLTAILAKAHGRVTSTYTDLIVFPLSKMVKTYRIDPKLDWLEALHPTLPCLLEVQLRVNQSFYEEARALKLRTAFFSWIKHF